MKVCQVVGIGVEENNGNMKQSFLEKLQNEIRSVFVVEKFRILSVHFFVRAVALAVRARGWIKEREKGRKKKREEAGPGNAGSPDAEGN